MQLLKFARQLALPVMLGAALATTTVPSSAASIYDSGYTQKIKMTASQRTKVRRINRAATAKVNRIFRKYGIRRRAQPEMSKLMAASGELQSAARAERNALAKVFTPTQLQQYDRIMRDVENRIVRAAK
jgi:ABC-type transporter MlaC component